MHKIRGISDGRGLGPSQCIYTISSEEGQKERKRMKIWERLYVNDYILGKTQALQSQTQ